VPKYLYRCESCGEQYNIRHSIKEKRETCEKCETKTLIRVPTYSGNHKIKDTKKAGDLVNKYIENAKEEIKDYKEELKRVEYEE